MPGVAGQLARLTDLGLPLPAALMTCAAESSSRSDARELRRLAGRIEAGESLEEAVQKASPRGRAIYALIAAGLKTGRLPRVLEAYLNAERHVRELWRRFWQSLLYPGLVLIVAMAIMLVALTFIVPQFKDIFSDFGVELPWITILLVALSDHVLMAWPVYLILLLIAAVLACAAPSLPIGAWWDWVPIVGRASIKAGLSEFCALLAVYIEGDMPLPEALASIAASARSRRIRQISGVLSRRIADGMDPQVAADDSDFPPDLRHIFRWCNTRDQFALMLRNHALSLAAESRVRVAQIAFLLQPLVVVCLGLGAGLIVISLFMPLVVLLNLLS
jgi:type IV pilus assembly protein PilC